MFVFVNIFLCYHQNAPRIYVLFREAMYLDGNIRMQLFIVEAVNDTKCGSEGAIFINEPSKIAIILRFFVTLYPLF